MLKDLTHVPEFIGDLMPVARQCSEEGEIAPGGGTFRRADILKYIKALVFFLLGDENPSPSPWLPAWELSLTIIASDP